MARHAERCLPRSSMHHSTSWHPNNARMMTFQPWKHPTRRSVSTPFDPPGQLQRDFISAAYNKGWLDALFTIGLGIFAVTIIVDILGYFSLSQSLSQTQSLKKRLKVPHCVDMNKCPDCGQMRFYVQGHVLTGATNEKGVYERPCHVSFGCECTHARSKVYMNGVVIKPWPTPKRTTSGVAESEELK